MQADQQGSAGVASLASLQRWLPSSLQRRAEDRAGSLCHCGAAPLWCWIHDFRWPVRYGYQCRVCPRPIRVFKLVLSLGEGDCSASNLEEALRCRRWSRRPLRRRAQGALSTACCGWGSGGTIHACRSCGLCPLQPATVCWSQRSGMWRSIPPTRGQGLRQELKWLFAAAAAADGGGGARHPVR